MDLRSPAGRLQMQGLSTSRSKGNWKMAHILAWTSLHPTSAWTSLISFLNSRRQVTIFNRLQSDFTVVSVLEQLEVGLEVLECLLPSYFKVGHVDMLHPIVSNIDFITVNKLFRSFIFKHDLYAKCLLNFKHISENENCLSSFQSIYKVSSVQSDATIFFLI